METLKLSQKSLNRAIVVINNGGVIVFPTDTVYGFLADATNKKAVEKIFRIKKRPRSKPLAVFVKDIKMAKELAKIDERQEKILRKYWFTRRSPRLAEANGEAQVGAGGPRKYTFILKQKPGIKLYGMDKYTIALRIPKYKFLNDLLKEINKPLAQTSVNISSQPPITKISDILKFCEKCGNSGSPQLVIDGGDLKNGNPSKIIDLTVKVLTRLR